MQKDQTYNRMHAYDVSALCIMNDASRLANCLQFGFATDISEIDLARAEGIKVCSGKKSSISDTTAIHWYASVLHEIKAG